jgi:hypothetical protein
MKNLSFALIVGIGILLNAEIATSQPPTKVIKPTSYSDLQQKLTELDKLPSDVIVDVAATDPKDTSTFTITIKQKSADKTTEKLAAKIDFSGVEPLSEQQVFGMIDEVMAISNADPKPMCGSIPSVIISQVNVGKDYQVQADYKYTYHPGKHAIVVPKGTIYDRASIPPIFWLLISQDDVGNVAPLIHDYLYRHGGKLPTSQVTPYRTFAKQEADELFRTIMRQCGVKPWRREAAYQAVKNFAGFAWRGQ